ncbi:conserved phage C-terminal domain-containing protein [Lysinibacillus endophyticus]|uniref:conserved phage C-terminal domain-containing protein n=1 Tax=Ureibacillus endophyticus TaxID=1978490 RepID=UPI00209D90CF|nr:conserved phage C-terminal domain-containing protein [Lysinibacillus endophyticus]
MVLDRGLLNDARLSWKAKGILAYMLSMLDDWVFYVEELMKHGSDGERSFRSGFNELKKFGYLERFPVYENHQIVKWETIVYEVPQNLLSQNVNVSNINSHTINQQNEALLNTDFKLNTELLNTDSKVIVEFAIPYKEIIDYLNKQANTNYRHTTKTTQKHIKARFNEGFTEADFKTVIDKKVSTWLHDENMNKYLRPETLFGTKFESYLNEKVSGEMVKNEREPYVFSDGINF